MSIVSSYTSEIADDALKRQQRAATLWSILISFLVVVLLALVLFLVLIPGWFVETKTIVAYAAPPPEEEVIEKPVMTPQVQRKPSAPSSAMAKVIASVTPTPTAVPVPEVEVPDPSTDFGSGDDFGDGWGSGSGSGGGGGGTTFFGQTSKGERFCYVIDYSMSMSGKREELMRKELAKSIGKVPSGAKYQMIFFAGPAWVAGSKVKDPRAKKLSIIEGEDGKEYKWTSPGNAHQWKPKGARQVPQWIESTRATINDSKSLVRRTELVWGTQWKSPLEMALSMSPPPQVIYFMTDGAAGKSSEQTARTIGAKAKALGITINCIAMMDPAAQEAMGELAKRTGGQFTKVKENGRTEKIPVK